ncbi:MAG: hypothetical protein QOD57_3926 [Actinomycetota bacterium]|jgi:hypothetical protein|nr:hypothetical protein [Actinomycetota bacterium]MDQ1497153.1 hypothetical protein [Actinomycetota bacterium]MDQ1506199.1 hypothetical protein [Actinomycetota bacterium]
MAYSLTDELRLPAMGNELDQLNRGIGALTDHPSPSSPVQVIEIEGLDLHELELSMRLVTACEINANGG